MSKAFGKPDGSALMLGPLAVDLDGYYAFLGDRPLALGVSELRVLGVLVANKGRVTSRKALSEALGLTGARSVDAILSALRKQLGPESIRNVRNRGWMLAPEELKP